MRKRSGAPVLVGMLAVAACPSWRSRRTGVMLLVLAAAGCDEDSLGARAGSAGGSVVSSEGSGGTKPLGGAGGLSGADDTGARPGAKPTGASLGVAGPAVSGAGAAGEGAEVADAGADSAATAPVFNIPFDLTGIIGTGQSLAVGEPDGARGTPGALARLTTQPYQNLSLSTGTLAWPVDPNDNGLRLIPLIEPIGRPSTAYPSSWPTNIAGETPHAAMANQISALVLAAHGADYPTVHSEVGENGQCLSFLVKGAAQVGVNGHAYQASLIETAAINRLARAAGKTFGVGAITVTHGECDAGNANYETQLRQLWSDYAGDLTAITGQSQLPLLIVSQQHASGNDRAPSTIAQWRIGVDFPAEAVCAGPKYQYPYTPDGIHLLVDGYEQLGEKYAQIYYERVISGHDWQPLQPTGAVRDGNVITVHFHVPVPPLVWEDSFPLPHQRSLTQWSAGKGFEVRAGDTPVNIAAVELSGQDVRITCSGNVPQTGLTVGYALSADPTAMTTPHQGTTRWGVLRDSDPFVGRSTGAAQPNFAVAFELPVL